MARRRDAEPMAVVPAGLVTLARDFLAACAARDADAIAASVHQAGDASFIAIGAPADDRRETSDAIERLGGLQPARFHASHPAGWVHGDVAWLVDFATFEPPEGRRLETRATVVLVRVEEAWKVVHVHLSEGVAREL